MEEQTIFYVLGGALVLVALALSAVGLRNERFPGARGLQLAVTAAVVVLVGATAAFAWISAEEEQEHREAELAEAAGEDGEEAGGESPAVTEVDSEAEAEGETTPGETTAGVDGAELFLDTGCGGCHQLEDAGTDSSTGPPLDASLGDEDTEYIETSIVDPNQVIAEGYGPDIMPQTYGEQLSPEELDALVQYLAESTGAQG
jgi:mono/diheme cytochrome c family protein